MEKRREAGRKIWRIFRFKERFELPDDTRFCRQKPLSYVREYVGSGQNDEAIKYKQQIAACKARPERFKLLYVFYELREIAANHTRCFRGNLLDERFEPASFEKIATWVGLSIKETEKIMKELEQISLIEQVSMPKFDLSLNDEPRKYRSRKKRYRDGSSSHKKSRTISGAHRKKHQYKTGSGIRNKKKKYKADKPDKDKKQNLTKDLTTTATAPATALNPINPTGTDSSRRRHQPVRLADELFKLYDHSAIQFANEVYDAIGTLYAKDSTQGRSEIGCWQQAWAKAQMVGLGPQYLGELWNRTVQEAMKLKLKRRRIKFTKSPEAVLRDMFDKLLASIKIRAEKASKELIKAESAMA